MGFKVKRKVFKLVFKDELEGLEVLAHSLNTGQFLEMEQAKAERAEGGKKGEGATQRMLELLAGALVSWNAEDDGTGEPIPANLSGIRSQDLDFNLKIINAWTDDLAGVSTHLPETSIAGTPSARGGPMIEAAGYAESLFQYRSNAAATSPAMGPTPSTSRSANNTC